MATIRKRSVYDRYAVTEKYLYSRARALTLRPNDLKVKLSADNQLSICLWELQDSALLYAL